MVLAVYAALPAFAVHDENFQLDGDVLASTTTNVGGNTQNLDWDSLFTSLGAPKALPAGFTASGFDRDFGTNPGCSLTAQTGTYCTSDDTTFATGSKDTLPITPGWQCNHDANVNSKIDIDNSYAGAYTNAAGEQILYFGMERNTNTGDANVGFWFLQDDVGCSSASGTHAFTGDHSDGDLLIVSAFTNGGSVSTIDVYRWVGGANGALNPTPVAHGVDCRDPATGTGDTACAVANTAPITTPWLTAAKTLNPNVGHTLPTAQFFEGGLNLTKANLGGKCFNVFIGDTRSSQSLTATLFDFARGKIGECTSTTVTTPQTGAGGSIPAGGLSIGANARVDVRDSALLTVTGVPSYGGNVTFSLCGPLALDSTTNCQTGGVQIGSPVAVAGTSPETVISPTATLTSVGRYCWRAEYSGDDTKGVPGSSDPSNATSTTECFKVNPLQPTLPTQATTGPVDFGQSISDTVTLSGTAKQPGTDGIGPGGTINATAGTQANAAGNINVTAFGPDNCTTVALATVHTAANGDGSYFGPGSATEFTPSSPGQYTYVASYDGNSPNTLGVTATPCANQPSNEKVTVRQIPTEISTHQRVYPNDSATITSSVLGNNLPATGTVTFTLWDNANCTGTALYTETKTGVGGAHSITVSTNNTTVAVDANGTVYWKVTYATGDSAHTGRQSNCVENTVLTFNNDAGPGTLFP